MIKKYLILWVFISFLNLGNSIAKEKIRVVTTTTLVSSILNEIGKDRVEIQTVIPAGMCPGHFDISFETVNNILNSDIFIYHGWEKWAKDLIIQLKNKKLRIIKTETEGNWMIPDININAANELCKYLVEIDRKNENFYKNNLKLYNLKVSNISRKIKRRFSKYQGKNIICAEMQKDFLTWLGFNVILTYGRPEEINLKDFKEITSSTKKNNVILIADNLQSGAYTGKEIAKDLKIRHVVLTNFPLKNSYFEAIESNLKELENKLK